MSADPGSERPAGFGRTQEEQREEKAKAQARASQEKQRAAWQKLANKFKRGMAVCPEARLRDQALAGELGGIAFQALGGFLTLLTRAQALRFFQAGRRQRLLLGPGPARRLGRLWKWGQLLRLNQSESACCQCSDQ